MGMSKILAAFLVTGLVPLPTFADTLEIPASRDNTLFLDQNGLKSSGSGEYLFVGNNSGSNTRRAVLRFDLGAVPAGAVIESAVIHVHVSSVPQTQVHSIGVHRLTADWGEGASVSDGGAGAASEPGDATWIHRFYPDSLWTSPGGDFDPVSSASVEIGDLGDYQISSPALAEDVQSWLQNPSANFGWILVGAENASSTVKRIDSRENIEATFRPVMTVTFNIPTPVLRSTWGRIKHSHSQNP